jgi:pilus assembly protein CpaB
MRLRAILFAGLAIVIAFGTVQLARNWLSKERSALEAQAKVPAKPIAYVMVAAKDLPTGSFLRPADLRWQAWPDDQVDQHYLVKEKSKPEDLSGAVVRLKISAGEPVTAQRVIKPGDRGFLAAVLSPGTRAISVPVTSTSGVAGLVFPGDRVDLILSHQIKTEHDPNAAPRTASETVLSDIRVLAVDQTTNDQDNKPVLAKTVTFEVTPKQAEAIEVASDLGKLSLSLRSLAHEGNEGEATMASIGTAVSHTWDSDVSPLLSRMEQAPTPHAAPTVTVLRGGSDKGAAHGQAGTATPAIGASASGLANAAGLAGAAAATGAQ